MFFCFQSLPRTAVGCLAPVLRAGELVVSGCADSAPLGASCVLGCSAQYTARGPATSACALTAPHVARWVSAGGEFSCAPIGSLFCQTDQDCQRIDKGAVCVPASTATVGESAAGGAPADLLVGAEASPPATFPQPATMGGCRCSSARYTGYFCETPIDESTPTHSIVPTWSVGPAVGAIIALTTVVALTAHRLRRDVGGRHTVRRKKHLAGHNVG